jgi:peptidyl-prolyl cis-trans isomerase A (cyclophilin A)
MRADITSAVHGQYAKKAFWIYFFAAALLALSFQAKAKEVKKDKTKEVVSAEKKSEKKEKNMIAVFETNMGTFKAKLFADLAPQTVANFAGLADGTKEYTDPKTGKKTKGHFYDGLIFHRIIAGFMIQGGDPLGTGTGGPGYQFDSEISPKLSHGKAGMLSMANAGPNTNGSQFFITVAPQPRLDGGYSVFGEVTEGLDVVMEISKVKTAPGDRPLKDVVMKSVKIIKE